MAALGLILALAVTTQDPAPQNPRPFAEECRILHTLDGEARGDQFGWVAKNAGDTDGDGVNDILVGAPTASYESVATGKIYVYSGKTGALLFAHLGAGPEQLGISVDSAGDVDGDGHADVIVGGHEPSGAGVARVFSGQGGGLIHELVGTDPGDWFGRTVKSIGDWDADGHGDFVVAATNRGAGQVIGYSGADASVLFQLEGENAGDSFGISVASSTKQHLLAVGAMNAGEGRRGKVYLFQGEQPEFDLAIDADATAVNYGRFFMSYFGDVTSDGVPDLFSVDFENTGGGAGSGRAYVNSGRTGERLHTFTGKPGEGLGIGDSNAGDVNGDGFADLVIGAWTSGDAAAGGGKAYLISGKDYSTLRTWTCNVAGEAFGFDTAGMGDVDGDGALDFLITGAYSPVHGNQTGRVYVLAGEAPKAAAQAENGAK